MKIHNNTKKIAIMMAVYNGGKFIETQIDSIIEQTNKDWTLYIRDDASTDNTAQIINNYCNKHNNIIKIEDDLGNLGCNENFKQIFRVVESDYYMFCDADDLWLPNKIEVSYNFLQEKETKYPNIPIAAHCDKIITDENLKITQQSAWKSTKFNPDSISKYKHIPFYILGGAASIFNHLAKERFFEEYPFSENVYYSYDGWLAFQTARYGKIFAIHQQLMMYRQHNQSVTSAMATHTTLASKLQLLKKLKTTLKHHWEYSGELKKIGYGGRIKYFYYRIIVAIKIIWGKLTIG